MRRQNVLRNGKTHQAMSAEFLWLTKTPCLPRFCSICRRMRHWAPASTLDRASLANWRDSARCIESRCNKRVSWFLSLLMSPQSWLRWRIYRILTKRKNSKTRSTRGGSLTLFSSESAATFTRIHRQRPNWRSTCGRNPANRFVT